jgi:hypothetical protein
MERSSEKKSRIKTEIKRDIETELKKKTKEEENISLRGCVIEIQVTWREKKIQVFLLLLYTKIILKLVVLVLYLCESKSRIPP